MPSPLLFVSEFEHVVEWCPGALLVLARLASAAPEDESQISFSSVFVSGSERVAWRPLLTGCSCGLWQSRCPMAGCSCGQCSPDAPWLGAAKLTNQLVTGGARQSSSAHEDELVHVSFCCLYQKLSMSPVMSSEQIYDGSR